MLHQAYKISKKTLRTLICVGIFKSLHSIRTTGNNGELYDPIKKKGIQYLEYQFRIRETGVTKLIITTPEKILLPEAPHYVKFQFSSSSFVKPNTKRSPASSTLVKRQTTIPMAQRNSFWLNFLLMVLMIKSMVCTCQASALSLS